MFATDYFKLNKVIIFDDKKHFIQVVRLILALKLLSQTNSDANNFRRHYMSSTEQIWSKADRKIPSTNKIQLFLKEAAANYRRKEEIRSRKTIISQNRCTCNTMVVIPHQQHYHPQWPRALNLITLLWYFRNIGIGCNICYILLMSCGITLPILFVVAIVFERIWWSVAR